MSKATNTSFLCSRGRRLRFARSSEAALAQPSSRRLSFSARRRRSGEGSAPDPPRPRRGRAPGGRGGAARAPTERARAAGNAGSPGSRLTLRAPGCARRGQLPPVPVSAARAPAAAAARAAGTSHGSGRTGGAPRLLRHGVSLAPATRARLTAQARGQKSGYARPPDQIPSPCGRSPLESWRTSGGAANIKNQPTAVGS